jgi:hypothetical protein
MKVFALSAALASQSVYSIYNMQSSSNTDDSFQLTWADHNRGDDVEPIYDADYYQVSVTNRQTGEEVDSQQSMERSIEFSGLESATIYDINIAAMNQTSGLEISSNRFEARTNGEGVSITSTWESGAQGNMFWPMQSINKKGIDESRCGTGVTFTVPCATNDMISLGVGDNVSILDSTNTTMTLRVSKKSGLNYINWVSFGQGCEWGEYTPEDFSISEFSAYEDATMDVEPSTVNSWVQNPGFTMNQVIIDIPEEMRSDCAPSISVSVNCEVTVGQGGWSLDHDEGSGEFDAKTGVATISGIPSNDHITQVGVAYEFSDECDGTPSVSITYSAPKVFE